MVDPSDAGAVGAALVRFVQAHLEVDDVALHEAPTPAEAGMSTFIWFARLSGAELPDEWRRDLVLRLHAHPDEAEVNAREAAVQQFVATHGYPAPRPLVVVTDLGAGSNPFGLPFMVMPKAPGVLVLKAVTSRPWSTPTLLRAMADLQLELHELATEGCPLPYDAPLVDRLLTTLDAMCDAGGWDEPRPRLAWLRDHADCVRTEDAVLVHNDFHPLNILVADDGSMTVIDWTDAALGDRHVDVARTIALFWVASIATSSRIERVALRAARGWLARTYRRAYDAGFTLDERRLTYWEVVHLVRGQMQVLGLARPAEGARTAAADDVPADLATRLAARADATCARFERLSAAAPGR